MESSCQAAQRKEPWRKVPPASVLKVLFFLFEPPHTDCSATKTASVQVLLGIYWAVRKCYQATLCRSQQAQEFLEHVKDSAIIQHLQCDFSKLTATKARWLILWINLCHKPCTITPEKAMDYHHHLYVSIIPYSPWQNRARTPAWWRG